MGRFKTVSGKFPKSFIQRWFDARVATGVPRGGHITMHSTFETNDGGAVTTFPMYAVAWHDKTCKKIISNVGTTLTAGTPSIRHWTRLEDIAGIPTTVDRTTAIPRPAMIELFYKCFSAIDVNDHIRQGLLAIERTWVTNSWATSLFGTLFGVAITKAYCLHKFESKAANRDHLEFYDFIDRLGAELIDVDNQRDQMLVRGHDADVGIVPEPAAVATRK
jgi:hypothetical protein